MSRLRAAGSWGAGAMAVVGAAFTVVESPTVESALFGGMFIAFAVVGLVLRTKVPGNAIGGLLLAVGTLAGIGGIGAALTLLAPPTSTAAGLARWALNWMFFPIIGVVLILLVVFPTGRLLSPRWNWAVWMAVIFVVFASVGAALYPWPPDQGGPNPLAVGSLGDLWLFLQDVSGLFLLVAALAGIASIVIRYRRAESVERHQLKWFLAAAALLPVAIGLGDVFRQVQGIIVPTAFILFPMAIGVAITKYRLYDIDRLISRTVAYGLITLILVGAFTAVVFLLGRLLPDQSDLAVAASTLTVAALFNPLRRRVQAAVDRRFNRSSYDTERVVDGFGRRLRAESDLDELSRDLVQVAGSTMQPACTSLWLKERT